MAIIKHSRDKVGDFQGRVLLHIPIGILTAIPVLGWGLTALFIVYQRSEDEWTRDRRWKDYYGAVAGNVIGVLAILGYVLWRLL
tara:strand:+ start:543 stop:794 length:252 start_codon:yes stop_codon:yes gene_type:complete